jgi:benzoyl-CoA reductase/2-hydroxyglutaryl-CoA dehydratase subunit BcrC/BadD/HgdB
VQATGRATALNGTPSQTPPELLATNSARQVEATIAAILETNQRLFTEERDKLEKWADDKLMAAEEQLRNTKARIAQLKRDARKATTLHEQSGIQQELSALERLQRKQRQDIFAVEDEIIDRRDALIQALQERLKQTTEEEHLFTLRWTVV